MTTEIEAVCRDCKCRDEYMGDPDDILGEILWLWCTDCEMASKHIITDVYKVR